MSSLVKVENDKPMMKYLVAQFVGGKDISSAKEGLVSGRVLRRSCVIVGLVHLTAQCAAQSSLFVSLNNLDIYSVDSRNCTADYVGTAGLSFADIALTPSGQLYGLSDGDLYHIDTTNADVTFVGSSSAAGNSLVALNDSVLLTEDSAKLYGISTTDATTWLIGTIGQYGVGDLAWFEEELYLAAYGMLVRITLLPDASGIDSVVTMSSVGTMAMVPAYLSDIQSSLIGFNALEVICYSPYSGSSVALCGLILPDLVTGAASYRLPMTPWVGCSLENAVNDDFSSPILTFVQDNGWVHVTWKSEEIYESWSIVDSRGSQISQGMIGSSSQGVTVRMTGLSRGAYFLRISGPKAIVVRRVYLPD